MRMPFASAVRNLRRDLAFSVVVVATLALGIGATTAMFSVVDSVLLRPLPYRGIERFSELTTSQSGPVRSPGITGLALPQLRDGLADLAAIEGYQMGSATITGGREPAVVAAPRITPQLLSFVGATPHLGRLFNDDDLRSTVPTAIISYRLWLTNFGGSTDVIGRALDIDDQPHTIVGVMSPHVRYPEANAAIWRPLNWSAASRSRQRVMVVMIRHPGVSSEQLAARLDTLSARLREIKLLTAGQSMYPDLLLQQRFGRADAKAFWMMFAAVSLVLLVACVNVSNLMLARASRRHGEIALRTALGASRSSMIASSLTESLILAVGGGVVGVGFAQALISVLLRILPPQLTYLTATAVSLDQRVLVFAALVSLVTCVLSGLLPAQRASTADPLDAIKQQAPTVLGRRDERWQSLMLTAQMSVVLILLAGAGLLLRSFITLSRVESGFNPDGLAIVDVLLTPNHYPTGVATRAFLDNLEQRLEASGMDVTVTDSSPLTSLMVFGNVTPEAEEGIIGNDLAPLNLPKMEVAGDFFKTVGIPILAGRSFATNDVDAVVVNDRLAKRYWGNVSAIGHRFRVSDKEPWRTVIGVVGDVKVAGLTDPVSHGMEVYTPPDARQSGGFYTVLARSDRDPSDVIGLIKQTLWNLDSRIPVTEAMSMNDRIGESLYRQRFFVRLSTTFTAIATVLAMIGMYGTATYWVARRRRELAIRIAVGASPAIVMRAVIIRMARLAVFGGAFGLVLAIAGARTVQSMLFAIDARDPATLTLVSVLLVIVAITACAVPAIRASRVDPMTTLRTE